MMGINFCVCAVVRYFAGANFYDIAGLENLLGIDFHGMKIYEIYIQAFASGTDTFNKILREKLSCLLIARSPLQPPPL